MMTALADQIRGRWRRPEAGARDDQYPLEIEFLEDGVYLSHAPAGGGFEQWGGGDYEIVAPDRIRLQIQTDEMVTYEVHATQVVLHFKDPSGFEFEYRKVD